MNHSASTPAMAPAVSNVLSDLALAINQAPGVLEVQSLVVAKSMGALGGSAGSVMMPGDIPGTMRVVAAIGAAEKGEAPPESPVAEWVVREDKPVLLLGRSGPLSPLLRREDIRDAVCVPLRYGGKPIGALSVSNSSGREPFNDNDVALLTSIGHLAAVALKNTMLYEEARSQHDQLQSVLRQLWTVEEDERRRLASDLHDGPAQALFHIAFQLQTARQLAQEGSEALRRCLEKTENVTRDTLTQVRAIMAGLRPMSLDDLGLVPALRTECGVVNARGFVHVAVTVSGEPRRLPADLENGLFRMAREALTNAERHSGAKQVDIRLDFGDPVVTLTVQDEGCGFSKNTARKARLGGRVGLAALKERADALGITVSVRSEEGHGTQVTLQCPGRKVP